MSVLALCIGLFGCTNTNVEPYEPYEVLAEEAENPVNVVDVGEINSAMNALRRVLLGEQKVYSLYSGYYYLKEYYQNLFSIDYSFEERVRFAVVDMDGDGIPEVVLNFHNVIVEVLHYEDGRVYSYSFVPRAMGGIKTDGTFGWGHLARVHGFRKITFYRGTYEFVDLAVSSNIPGTWRQGYGYERIFQINDTEVIREEFETFFIEQEAKDDVEWYPFIEENIDMVFSQWGSNR